VSAPAAEGLAAEARVEAAVVASARALMALLALDGPPVTNGATLEALLALAERLDEIV
jgi:hypothetical protein